MEKTLSIVQIVISVLLIVSILLQQRGTSLGEAFGGESGIYTSRRGGERYLYVATIVLAVLFFTTAIVAFLLGA